MRRQKKQLLMQKLPQINLRIGKGTNISFGSVLIFAFGY